MEAKKPEKWTTNADGSSVVIEAESARVEFALYPGVGKTIAEFANGDIDQAYAAGLAAGRDTICKTILEGRFLHDDSPEKKWANQVVAMIKRIQWHNPREAMVAVTPSPKPATEPAQPAMVLTDAGQAGFTTNRDDHFPGLKKKATTERRTMNEQQIETLKKELVNTESRNQSLCESAHMAYLENDSEAHNRLSAEAKFARNLAAALRAALALAEERRAMEGWEIEAHSDKGCVIEVDDNTGLYTVLRQSGGYFLDLGKNGIWGSFAEDGRAEFATFLQALAAANAAMKAGE